jgi:hypothetical protein
MRKRARPTCPPEGRGPGGPPQGGAIAPSGGGLQGIPNGRRVIHGRPVLPSVHFRFCNRWRMQPYIRTLAEEGFLGPGWNLRVGASSSERA